MKQLNLIYQSLKTIERLLEETLANREPQELDNLKDYLDKEQVLKYFKITDSTYYRWIAMGRLKPYGTNGALRFKKEDLLKLMERRRYRERM